MEWMLQAVNTLTVKVLSCCGEFLRNEMKLQKVSNSPLNDLKLWLWKKAAGDYDKDAIKVSIIHHGDIHFVIINFRRREFNQR